MEWRKRIKNEGEGGGGEEWKGSGEEMEGEEEGEEVMCLLEEGSPS